MTKKGYVDANGYKAHKSRQRQAILAAAEELFIDKGLIETSISEIARSAGVDRSTVYRYFANMEEIAWAIEHEILKRFYSIPQPDFSDMSRSGYEQIQEYAARYLDFSRDNERSIRFNAELDHFYSHNKTVENIKRYYPDEYQMEDPLNDPLYRLIQKGMADGSIREDMDPRLTAFSIMNALSGATQRVAGRKHILLEAKYYDPFSFVTTLVDILLVGIKAPV